MTSHAQKVIEYLDQERLRAFQPHYLPAGPKFGDWVKLRDMEPSSIHHDAVKKRACRWTKCMSNYSKDLFTLYAITISISRLGAIKVPEDISNILTWWDGVEQPTKCLSSAYEALILIVNESPKPSEHTVQLPIKTNLRSPTTSSIPHLIPDAFNNWHNRGIEAIMPRLMTIAEASQDPTTKAMWRNGLPRLSRQVLRDEVTDLIGKITSQTIFDIGKKTATIRIGDYEEKGNLKLQQQYMGRSLYQINLPSSEMKAQTPCTISNVFVPEARDLFPDDWRSQNSILVQFPDSGLSFNVAPAGNFTDFHADSCTIGRAVCFGSCIKGWLCFPPTAKNLCLWQDGLGLPGKCAKYGMQLEGGIFVRTGNDPLSAGNCIDMSSGTIHCVLTIEGGLLGGVNYSVSEALLLSSRMICMQFRRWQQVEQITEDVKWWRLSFTKCLSQADDKLYPVAWYSLVLLVNETELQPARAGHKVYKEIRAAEKATWTQWQKIHTRKDGRLQCICGKAYDHWRGHYSPEMCSAVVCGIKLSL